jgi:hypothetical protein
MDKFPFSLAQAFTPGLAEFINIFVTPFTGVLFDFFQKARERA